MKYKICFFSQEAQDLRILLSPRGRPSFRGLDPSKLFLVRTIWAASLKAILATLLFRFLMKMIFQKVPQHQLKIDWKRS